MLGKRAKIEVSYQGVDITGEVDEDLINFDYVDNASGESDTISLSLKDDQHIWLKDWFPQKGDMILPTIKTTNWKKDGDKQSLPCGRFFVDEPTYEGRPSQFNLAAISSPLNTNFKDVDRSKNWINVTLQQIARDIAGRAGMSLQYLGNNNPVYKAKEQAETPDSQFLSELCEEEGLAMKVTDSKIVIFDEREFERRPPVATFKEVGSEVLSYSFGTILNNTKYSGVRVKYYHPDLGRTIDYLYSVGESSGDKVYQVNKRVNTEDEARRIAQRTARRLNKKETTCSLSVVGDVELLGGTTINLEGFGAFDGRYYIEKAAHSLGSGYTTNIEARRVLEGY